MQLLNNKWVIGIKEYFLMAVGMCCYAFGWVACIMPAKGVGGGAAGLSLVLCKVLETAFGLDVKIGTMVFLINVVLLLLAGFIVGWNFGVKTIISICFLSFAMNFWQEVLPPEGLFQVEAILLVIMGAVIAGFGVALCFKQGGSTGGVDIVAAVINKYRTVRYGNIVMCSDFLIIGSSLFVGYTVSAVIYGYILTAVFGYTVDLLMAGSSQSSQIMIMSKHYDAVADALVGQANRGVTMLDGMGWYTKVPSKVVVCVCHKREISQVLKLVRSVDPDAFITVGSVVGTYGKGFGQLGKI